MRLSTEVGSSGRPGGIRAATGEAAIPLRSAKVRAEASDDITVPLLANPKIVTGPPLYGLIGSSVPFTSMTRDVVPCWRQDEASGVGKLAATAAIAAISSGASIAKRKAM